MSKESAHQPTPIELAAPGKDEYEVWASQETATPTLLILISDSDNALRIIDPSAGNREVFASNHYLAVVAFLRDEEYLPVKGRMKLNVEDANVYSPL